jgi:hypothetical protein
MLSFCHFAAVAGHLAAALHFSFGKLLGRDQTCERGSTHPKEKGGEDRDRTYSAHASRINRQIWTHKQHGLTFRPASEVWNNDFLGALVGQQPSKD